ncbi:MAG: hypothetical protein Q4C00_06675 [Bacillota bacterium]|nr:hypothetical protein [Bacillota bacterium]
MEKCAKCGAEVEKNDVYVINDKNYCEDCAIAIRAAGNPSKRCGE